LNLVREPARFLAATCGVVFAVVLVFMQLGLSDALYKSSVRLHDALSADIILISPQSPYLAAMKPFSRRRLQQARAVEGVASVGGIYAALTNWKNPENGSTRLILLVGFDPTKQVLEIPAVQEQQQVLRLPDKVLFDAASRREYGPVAAHFRAGRPVSTEVGRHLVTVAGLFEMGTSFGIDGTVVTSDVNFLRMVSHRPAGLIDIGVVKLSPEAELESVRAALDAYLPADVEVLTKRGYVDREMAFWAQSTPIGFVFAFGAIIGIVVGIVVVYQILFADVSEHLAEYATLKAIGYRNRDLAIIVLQEATILALVGFVPGCLLSMWLYRVAQRATFLPLGMEPGLFGTVLVMTVVMCCVSGILALRKVRAADPAEIF
jgi:putative ABC transport system permease protein